MSDPARGPVLVDTGVFGARLIPRGKPLASGYRPLLAGRPALVCFVTVAELRFGARLAGWGQPRRTRLEHELAQVQIVWPGPELAETYAALRSWCVQTGHGLGQKEHEADRWVAGTAIWLDIPLIAHDAIFKHVNGLDLQTRL